MLTSYKHVATARKVRPDPMVELNPETAKDLDLREGDWVYIETKHGRVKQKLSLNGDLNRRVVIGAFGWWYPEEPSTMYGWERANINMLTPSGPEYDPVTGSTQLRGIPCKVYRADS